MKVVNVSNGNYKVTVQNGGVITLNTGVAVGTVIITGDLTVLGTTTTVDTANMTIEDNIIFLNKGETGSTVTEGSSGIQIDRGSSADPEFVWDESVSSFVPSLGTVSGTWVFRRAPGTLSAIQTQSINTNSGILYLISSGSGGYITVTGTANYERNILTYVDAITYNPISGVSVIDDDRIPNIKAVTDYVTAITATFVSKRFGIGDTLAEGYDTSNGDASSKFEFKVDNVLEATINSSGLTVGNLNADINTISSTSGKIALAPFSDEVEIDGYITLLDQGSAPALAASAAKIYTKSAVGGGDTGLYYVNSRLDTDGVTTLTLNEELISRKRALLLSMIF